MTSTIDLIKQLEGRPVDTQTLLQLVTIQAQQLDVLLKEHEQVMDVLNGDPTRDLPGLRVRLKEAELTIEEWKRYKLIVKGVAVGMTLTMITSISTLITLISQVVKVTP